MSEELRALIRMPSFLLSRIICSYILFPEHYIPLLPPNFPYFFTVFSFPPCYFLIISHFSYLNSSFFFSVVEKLHNHDHVHMTCHFYLFLMGCAGDNEIDEGETKK